jgi:hypothetical protein
MPGPRSHRLPAGQGISVGSLGAGGRPLRDAADIIAADARMSAARWSRRVALSLKVSVSGDGKSAPITAGGAEAPQAATFELGLSHPVFGRPTMTRKEWTWVKQIARPYLAAAAERQATKAADAWGNGVITGWARNHGFR